MPWVIIVVTVDLRFDIFFTKLVKLSKLELAYLDMGKNVYRGLWHAHDLTMSNDLQFCFSNIYIFED